MIITDQISSLEEKIKALEEFKEHMEQGDSLSKNSVNTNNIQTLSRKVLKTPVIDDFTNAIHDHNTNSKGSILGLAGTKIYYVSDSSGGTVNRKLTFLNGILISET